MTEAAAPVSSPIAPKAEAFAFRSDGYAWYVLAVLCVTALVSAVDRQILNLLVEPIKASLQISDTQISLLQGFAFALFYAFMAIPLGRLADTTNRRNVIIVGVVVWSLATMACGLATGFALLFVMRMFVGVGEATLTPAGYSLLSDYFPREQLSRAISIFTGMSFAGSGLALILGGFLLQQLEGAHTVALPLFGPVDDWQAAFILASAPGLLVAFLLFTVREPPRQERGRQVSAEATPLSAVIAWLGANLGAIGPLVLGFSVLAASQFALTSWIPTFFIRTHGWSASEIGYAYGLFMAFLSTFGIIAGGWIADALLARGVRTANLLTPIGAAALALPLVVSFPLVSDPMVALALVAPMSILGAMPFGAGTAAIPMMAPNRMRAQFTALYLLVANLVGGGIGPWSVAAFTDGVLGDPQLIRYSLATVPAALSLLAIVVLALALRPFGRAMAAAEPDPRG
jgi:MFS family permease